MIFEISGLGELPCPAGLAMPPPRGNGASAQERAGPGNPCFQATVTGERQRAVLERHPGHEGKQDAWDAKAAVGTSLCLTVC